MHPRNRAGLAAAAAGVAVAAFAAGFGANALAQQVGSPDRGLVASHEELVKFEMSFGRTAAGLPRRADRLDEVRAHVVVPDHLGDLVTITPHGDQVVLWYKGARGLRNVVLDRVTTQMWTVERGATSILETDVVR